MAKKKKAKKRGGPPKGVVPPHLRKFLFKKGDRATRKTARGAKKMAKGGRTRRQGIVSWLTSIFALLIGFGPVWAALKALFAGADPLVVGDQLQNFYNPLRGDKAALAAGYGSLLGGIVFKLASSELVKRAPIRSVIPAMKA